MSESFRLAWPPLQLQPIFFFFTLHFYPYLFCIFASLSIKGYKIFWKQGSGDSSRMQDAISRDGLGTLIPFWREWRAVVNLKPFWLTIFALQRGITDLIRVVYFGTATPSSTRHSQSQNGWRSMETMQILYDDNLNQHVWIQIIAHCRF